MIDITRYMKLKQDMSAELEEFAKQFNKAFSLLREANIEIYIDGDHGFLNMGVVTDEGGSFLDLSFE